MTHDFRFEYWQFPEETLKLKTGDCARSSHIIVYFVKGKRI